MLALISPREGVIVAGRRLQRVAAVRGTEFEVALPLVWIACPDGIAPDTHAFDAEAQMFVPLALEAPNGDSLV